MCCIFTCLWHIYWGCLPTKLVVYILQSSRKSTFSRAIYPDTRVFFSGILHFPRTCTIFAHIESFCFRCSAHPWDMYYICTCGCHILFWEFSHQFICAHPANASDILHWPRTSISTPGLFFFRFYTYCHDMYYICTCCWYILFQIFSHQYSCAHPADASENPHFSRTSIRTWESFFSGILHIPRTCTTFAHLLAYFISDI